MATRTMATEKQLSMKIKSTKGIRKITASMKMVSAAKLKGDESRLKAAIPYNKWASSLIGANVPMENATFEDIPDGALILPLTSDKGLCGGVNSFISRGIRTMVKSLDAAGKKKISVMVVGDKGRAQMRRFVPQSIVAATTEVMVPRNFMLASAVTSEVLALPNFADYTAVVIVYNKFINQASYTQQYKILTPLVSSGEKESLLAYEFEPDTKSEVLQDLSEYLLSSTMFHCLMESAASEQSARMSAMENATKNAGDMVQRLTLQYNRARQSRITTELIEIISGASALETKN